MIAALFVQKGGVYFDVPDVDPWDEARDARLYAGPWPVVAHPPCAAWCRLAALREATHGYPRGEDGGCFEAALRAVRTFGGVLEHPAWSDAWGAFDLPRPSSSHGGWQRGTCGGWSCYVEQARYGHVARKATWLYAYGTEPQPLRWGRINDSERGAVRWSFSPHSERPRIRGRRTSATPIEFRDVLLNIARSAERPLRHSGGGPGAKPPASLDTGPQKSAPAGITEHFDH